MRHRNKNKILDRKKAPRELMLRNMASSLIIYEKIKTTEAKAKTVQPLVERLINISKGKDLKARRALIEVLLQKKAIAKALEVLADKYQERPGGYTRIIKLKARQGDGAQMVQLELV
ncbi:MAG: 50S ribosomal protein L17 [Candidatus Moranbacteria bacterium]|nr:50S ribosomal protein L17 [Candidatus Moranbacteria bacterium]